MTAVSPATVAFLRGLIEAVVLAAIGALIVALSEVTAGDLALFAPIAVLALRQAEGIADARIDPSKQRVLGGQAGHTDGGFLIAVLVALVVGFILGIALDPGPFEL